ncbi:MAG: hypothetical protein CUN55_19075 [Phototrophicales bacterium]|nr:MAG: hypothetical protein CUN55_19075 [Phototrophicales bacterium]
MIRRCYNCYLNKNYGCSFCDSGFIDIRAIDGPVYAAKCLNDKCNRTSKSRVVAPGLPPLPPIDLDYDGSVLECDICESAAEWTLVAWNCPTDNDLSGGRLSK